MSTNWSTDTIATHTAVVNIITSAFGDVVFIVFAVFIVVIVLVVEVFVVKVVQ